MMNITAVDSVYQDVNTVKTGDKDKQAQLAKLKKACEQFESLFVYYMLKTMRSASQESSLLGEGMGSEIYTQLFDEGLSEKMAESGPFGIGDMLMKNYAKRLGLDPSEVKTYDNITSKPAYYRPNIKTKPKPPMGISRTDDLKHLDGIIANAAEENNVNPKLVKAVIMQESGGNPYAISAKGAKGLMQLMDGTALMLGVSDPFDIKQNIQAGAKYLSSLIKKFEGNITNALAAYNAGPGAVEKYNGVPPYEETRKYVSNIMDMYEGL
jgi:Rod binding domain-containing protein